MRTAQRSISAGDVNSGARRRMLFIAAGWLAFASAFSAAAETKKKTTVSEPAASATKKKSATPSASTKPKKPDAEPKPAPASSPIAPNVAIAADDLIEFQAQPAGVKALIESSLELARRNLAYTYNSSDPSSGGLDCSGFVYHVLRRHGFTQVPRDSSGQYVWVRRARGFSAVASRQPDSFELNELLPGDLLFWTGTYATDHDPPISHVMLYLGTEKSSGAKVMIGSSDGRTYRGLKRNGVSVFDFTLPQMNADGGQRATFIGYGRIPGLRQ